MGRKRKNWRSFEANQERKGQVGGNGGGNRYFIGIQPDSPLKSRASAGEKRKREHKTIFTFTDYVRDRRRDPSGAKHLPQVTQPSPDLVATLQRKWSAVLEIQ